jgi:hypothetical protein
MGAVLLLVITATAHPQESAKLNLRWEEGALSVTGVAGFPGETKRLHEEKQPSTASLFSTMAGSSPKFLSKFLIVSSSMNSTP